MKTFRPKFETEARIEVKKSRFIGRIIPVESKSEAEETLKSVKKSFSDAIHNCWAYRIGAGDGAIFRFSDEGEPSGTAGKPILESLEERNISNALLVVTRYFGGVKLGMGGLSRAYRECARAVIAGARLKEMVEMVKFKMHFLYSFEPQLRSRVYELKGCVNRSFYSQNVLWEVEIPKSCSDNFCGEALEICRGQLEIEIIGEKEDD